MSQKHKSTKAQKVDRRPVVSYKRVRLSVNVPVLLDREVRMVCLDRGYRIGVAVQEALIEWAKKNGGDGAEMRLRGL